MNDIIDFHTHAFPENIADKAMKKLLAEGNVRAYLDGRLSSLLASMDRYGIAKSVICSIATRPSQFEPIFEWSCKIISDRIIPFPSVHPDDSNWRQNLSRIKTTGFKGVKMHPYYQGFFLDEDRLNGIYEQICSLGLILVMHTGYDLAFEWKSRAGPAAILSVKQRFPQLKLITTHLGGWQEWDNVEKFLVGKQIFMDVSFALDAFEPERVRNIILGHPVEYVLFGTDSPWDDQGRVIRLIKDLKLPCALESRILWKNASELLGL